MPRQELVTKDFFTALPFWDKLENVERKTVERETKELAAAHADQVVSRARMGEHLMNLQLVLEGKGLFVKYLETLHFSYRTAYRYIEAYKAVKGQLPDIALQMAAARGMDLVGYQADRPFGPYTEPVKALPPPADTDKIPEWLDQIEEKRKEMPKRARRAKAAPPEASLRMAFASVYRRFKALPAGKGRVVWSKRLIGLLMAEMGLPGQHFEPEAVPEGFRPKVGRPKGTHVKPRPGPQTGTGKHPFGKPRYAEQNPASA
jgi:hypothetical protein